MTFISSLTIPQLGVGAGYALWGFRAAAMGHIECATLVKGYNRAFGESGGEALGAVLLFTRAVGSQGKRRIGLGQPGCCGVTGDELSIVAVLSAAQDEDADRRDAHLLWLLGRSGEETSAFAADAVGKAFRDGGLDIEAPPIEIAQPSPAQHIDVIHAAGNA